MRIGIDVRCLAKGRRTGVEEYTLNLLKNLFKIDSKNKYILFFNSYKASQACFGWIKDYPNVKIKVFRLPNKLLNFCFWYLGWPKIDKMIGGCDIFFMPNIIFGSASRKTKLIVTIHDLSFERYPETFSWKKRLWHIFINPKKICQRADKIMAISESTKNDLISIYGIHPEKITVIFNGLPEKFKPISHNDGNLIKIKEKYNLPYKFILYLGTIEPRKNIVGIIRAFNMSQKYAKKNNREDILKFKLVLAGYSGWLSKKIFQEAEKSEFKEKIIFIDSISDDDKEYLYNLASVFVYPSLFEGFGFPPLEALKCGIPTITSNNSSLPEVAGENAILIDPTKPTEIYEALKEILSSKELQEKLKSKPVPEFSWRKTAEGFLKLIVKFGKTKD